MITEVIFDIETKKLFEEISTNDPADLGVSLVSLYKRTIDDNFNEISGQIYSFFESDFNSMWPHFSNADRLIGFNSLKFDNLALASLCPFNFKKLNHFDILDKIKSAIGFRLSLNVIAQSTLGHTKSDNGINAVLYYQQNTAESLEKLKKYCEMDVMVTRDVYDFGLKNGFLKYTDKWNTPRTLEINFSYPKANKDEQQISLF